MENIIQDIGSLGLQFDKITYTSDYFPQVPAGCAVSIISLNAVSQNCPEPVSVR